MDEIYVTSKLLKGKREEQKPITNDKKNESFIVEIKCQRYQDYR
jgi:hypothetical protein